MSDQPANETVDGTELRYEDVEHHGEIVRVKYTHRETGATYYELYESTNEWVDDKDNSITPEF